jgi:hypothetical protein
MRRRRSRNGLAISLFSFQDIITCLTGIVLIISVMLALQVVAAPAFEDKLPAQATAEEIALLRSEVLGLSEEVNGYQTANGAGKATIDTWIPVAEVPALLQRARSRERKLESDKASARNALSQTVAQIAEIKKKREKAEAGAKKVEKSRESLLAKLHKIRTGGEVLFIPEPGVSLNPVLLECSGNRLRILTRHEDLWIKEIEIKGSPDTEQSLDQLKGWLKKRRKEGACVVILVRPSAVSAFSSILIVVRDLGWTVGWEPLPKESSIALRARKERK